MANEEKSCITIEKLYFNHCVDDILKMVNSTYFKCFFSAVTGVQSKS